MSTHNPCLDCGTYIELPWSLCPKCTDKMNWKIAEAITKKRKEERENDVRIC